MGWIHLLDVVAKSMCQCHVGLRTGSFEARRFVLLLVCRHHLV
jgi:hypothetical protein